MVGMREIALLVGLFYGVLCCSAASALPPNVTRQPVLSGLDQPVTIAFLPGDSRMLVLQKAGAILIADVTTLPATTAPYMTLTDIDDGGFERGLMDVAFDPAFATNGWFYLYYSPASSGRFRVSRFTHHVDHAHTSSELVLWEDNEPYSSHSHYGGSVDVGPDGMLWVVTGDEFDGAQPQDLARAGGKVVRIQRDGGIPADNPFVDGPGGNLDALYARGLRNPFRASWDLLTRRYFIGDVGGNVQSSATEDLHLIALDGSDTGRGVSFGWPDCEGVCGEPAHTDPIYTYPHLGAGASITGGFVYRGSQFPPEYIGRYFVADYVRGWIRTLGFDASGLTVIDEETFEASVGASLVDLKEGPDGSIYVIAWNLGEVWRYVYDGGNQPPSIETTVDAPVGSAPLQVTFDVVATDPEGDPLTVRWFFGDGVEATGASVTHTYASNGRYNAHVRVSDPTHVVLSPVLPVQVGLAPVVSIGSPLDGALFRAGALVVLSGSATDPDGVVPVDLTWTVRFLHNEHTHPGPGPFSGDDSAFTVPSSGHDFSDNTGYEITLLATDADGLLASDSVQIFPEKVDLTVTSSLPGATVLLDGFPRSMPLVLDTVIGFEHTLEALETACDGDAAFVFAGWADDAERERAVTVPEVDLSLSVSYSATGEACELPVTDGLVAWYRSGHGVAGVDGVVGSWADRAGNGLGLSGVGAPLLEPGALNGWPALVFDGVDDRLERIGGVELLPSGNSARTMIAVVRYDGVGFGGTTFGRAGCNEVFGLSVSDVGTLMVHGWCGGNDLISTESATGEGWLMHSVVAGDGLVSHWRDGSPIGTWGHSYATVPERLVVGAEIDATPHVAMAVAEILVYDRALGQSERVAVEAALTERYFPVPCEESGSGEDCNGNGLADACERRDAGGSVLLDGDDLVNIRDFALDGDFTFEAAARLGAGVTGADGLMRSTDGTQEITFLGNRVRLREAGGVDAIVAITPTPPGVWMHYAFVREAGQLSVYVDGQLDRTAPWSGVFRLGLLGVTSTGGLAGELDEVRVWGVARSPDEIMRSAFATVVPTSPGLLACWRFDDPGATQLVRDYSRGQNHASLGLTGAMGADDPVRVRDQSPVVWSDDQDGDGVLDACVCPGDRTGDGALSIADLLNFLASWFAGC